MKITWLGQAGLLFETDRVKIMVDPYLSDSVARINPLNKRRVPTDEKFLNIKPDIIVLTHNHLDHTDSETLKHYLNESSGVTVLASKNAWNESKKFGGNNNYVMFNRKTVWTHKNIVFEAVRAEHSDDFSIGVVIYAENKKYYITGDTLYNKEIFKDLPENIDFLFLPINGVGNNMNFDDANKFTNQVNAKNVVPIHFGLFDSLDPEKFECTNKIIPKIYEEITGKEVTK